MVQLADLTSPGPVHATAVALEGRGALIIGPSGSGKSALALALMSTGAKLIADDQVMIDSREGAVWLSCPPNLPPLIEARGVGLLAAELCGPTLAQLVIDLSQVETERLPPERKIFVLGCELPLVHKDESSHFAPAIQQYLLGGRSTN